MAEEQVREAVLGNGDGPRGCPVSVPSDTKLLSVSLLQPVQVGHLQPSTNHRITEWFGWKGSLKVT